MSDILHVNFILYSIFFQDLDPHEGLCGFRIRIRIITYGLRLHITGTLTI